MNDQAIEQEIQDKGLTAPRVTPADIEANIARCNIFNVGTVLRESNVFYPPALDLLTICVITTRNGFTVTGESACVSSENFDQELGSKIALDNAKQKLWPLMGYALKERLSA